MKKRYLLVFFVALVVLLLFASLFFRNLNNSNSESGNNGNSDSFFPITIFKPNLQVSINEESGVWMRDTFSDLPALRQDIAIHVRNTGNADAQDVKVTIKENWAVYDEYYLSLGQSQSDLHTISIYLDYDSTETLLVEATCTDSFDDESITLNADLPRHLDDSTCKLFITPHEQDLVNLKNEILDEKFFLTPNWMALRDWVGDNIRYVADSSVHGQDEYWQLPEETIRLRTGDCEDFSILLCSLLRADGWSTDNAYVVAGEKDNSYHAWVRIIYSGIEYNIEPQGDGWSTLIGDFLSLSGYDAEHLFNDVQFGDV